MTFTTKPRTGVKAYGVREVRATQQEVAAWVAQHGYQPPNYRVECVECGKRLWLSGVGLGSHRAAHRRQRIAAEAG